jgi:hypothetical protein
MQKRKATRAAYSFFHLSFFLFHLSCSTVPWSSGQGASPTRRRSVVRFHPGLLLDRAYRSHTAYRPYRERTGYPIWRRASPGERASRKALWVRLPPPPLVDGVCGVTACIRGCEPRGAGFDSRQTHGFPGVCSRESKLPPKQPHRVRLLAPLLLAMPVWLDIERRRTRNADYAGATPAAGSTCPDGVADASDPPKVRALVRFQVGILTVLGVWRRHATLRRS